MDSIEKTIIRSALEAALRRSNRVVVSYGMALEDNWAGADVNVEVWGVTDLGALVDELLGTVPRSSGTSHNESSSGQCQEIAVHLTEDRPAPTKRDLQRAVESIATEVFDRFDGDGSRLLAISTRVDSSGVSIEVSK